MKLRFGLKQWNLWRKQNPDARPDLHGADLDSQNLSGFNLSKTDLSGANLWHADLHGADLTKAHLYDANLAGANLMGAKLVDAKLMRANLNRTKLGGADMQGVELESATLVNTDLEGANLTGCHVFGISAWNVNLKGAIQPNLVITPSTESPIQVDNLEVAQFIYLLLNNQKIRQIIDTITSKVVLILGRFTPERKLILDAIRDALRSKGYMPVLFDFDRPSTRDFTEMVSTLAHMARFVIADITDAKSISQELTQIVPHLPHVPIQPLLLASQEEYVLFEHFKHFPWFLKTYLYESQEQLLSSLESKVIGPAESRVKQQTGI